MSRYVFASERHGVDVEVDLASQVLELEADAEESFWAFRERYLRQPPEARGGDANEIQPIDTSRPIPPYLHPTLADLPKDWGWTPAMAFALKAKAFDDGLHAAVELLVQRGTPALPGKRRLLEQVQQVLLSHWSPQAADPLKAVLVLLRSALSMTGTLEEPDRKLRLLVRKFLEDFESNAGASKPLGFYTWSPELEGVFKQDRLLQTELELDAAQTLLSALESEAHLLSAWRRHVQLPGRLTNPHSKPALDEEGDPRCFFPPSDSHEGRLVKELFQEVSPPPGFKLVDELMARIRDGRLDTTPTSRSGWYDHQLHALVPFLVPEKMPEAERLILGPRYRAELELQFQALFALTRETHIKQLEQLSAGGVPLIVTPRLSIEPLAEFYRRRAEGYLFVRNVLCEFLGAPSLASARRVTPTGTVEEPLLDELVWMEQVFRGAHAIVRQELGFEEVPEALLPAALLTRRWLRQWKEDPDLSRDPRCVVPLYFDQERGKTKVLAVLGFHATSVEARFKERPTVHLSGPDGRGDASAQVVFWESRHSTVRPVSAELYVSRVPDRAEFHSLCEEHVTADAIVKALEA